MFVELTPFARSRSLRMWTWHALEHVEIKVRSLPCPDFPPSSIRHSFIRSRDDSADGAQSPPPSSFWDRSSPRPRAVSCSLQEHHPPRGMSSSTNTHPTTTPAATISSSCWCCETTLICAGLGLPTTSWSAAFSTTTSRCSCSAPMHGAQGNAHCRLRCLPASSPTPSLIQRATTGRWCPQARGHGQH